MFNASTTVSFLDSSTLLTIVQPQQSGEELLQSQCVTRLHLAPSERRTFKCNLSLTGISAVTQCSLTFQLSEQALQEMALLADVTRITSHENHGNVGEKRKLSRADGAHIQSSLPHFEVRCAMGRRPVVIQPVIRLPVALLQSDFNRSQRRFQCP